MKTVILFSALFLSCYAMAQDNIQHLKDSLRNDISLTEGRAKLVSYRKLTNIYFGESGGDSLKMDTLLILYGQMIDEARQQNDMTFQGVAMANTLGALNNSYAFGEVFERAPVYMDFLEKNEAWGYYFPVCKYLIEAYLLSNDYEKALEEAQKMYAKASGLGNNTGVGLALYMMSNVYRDMDRNDEGEKCIRQCIDILKNEKGMLPFVADAYAHLGFLLLFQERYGEVLEEAKKFEEIIGLYETDSRTAQPVARSNLYRLLAKVYAGTGDFDNAELYCNKAESMVPGVINEIEKADLWALIYAGRKQYEQALAMLDKIIELDGDKKDAEAKVKIPIRKSEILARMGRFEEAFALYRITYEAGDSIRNVEFNARLDELRTVYEVDKLENENKIITIEKQRNRNYFLFALGGCFLLAIALGIWMYYSRIIVKKNRALYRQIKEQDRLSDELGTVTKHYEQMTQTLPETAVAAADDIPILPGNRLQRQLVARLHEFLLKDNCYATFDLDVQKLIPELATNRTYFFEALKAVTGKTPMEYINDLRLDEAKRLLDNSDLTIETISDSCGFNTTRTFYNRFQDRYRMTPASYRKMAKNTGE